MSAALVQKTTTKLKAAAAADQLQQLATISLMLEYDMDSTYNRYEEPGQILPQLTAATTTTTTTTTATTTSTTIATTTTTTRARMPLMQPITIDTNVLKMQKGTKVCLPPTPPITPNLQNTAQKRWRILAKVLRKDSEETVSSSSDEFSDEQTASVRRFKSFDLLRQDSFEDHISLNCLGKTENWYTYRMLLDEHTEYSVNIHHMERQLTANDLMGFNNTGNICVWPSEEALTALVLADLQAYRGKWILELGGGFTSLAGLMLAKYAKPYAVQLTDGNEVSVENVKKTVCLNELSCYTKCSVLKWQDVSARVPEEQAKFHIILCADCLFFDEARNALVDTICYYLAANGLALIMAPQRGKTLNLFRDECLARGFAVELAIRYNDTIWQRHLKLKKESDLYDEDLHYPLLLRLRKKFS